MGVSVLTWTVSDEIGHHESHDWDCYKSWLPMGHWLHDTALRLDSQQMENDALEYERLSNAGLEAQRKLHYAKTGPTCIQTPNHIKRSPRATSL